MRSKNGRLASKVVHRSAADLRRDYLQLERGAVQQLRGVLAAAGVPEARLEASAYLIARTIEGVSHRFVIEPVASLDLETIQDELCRMLNAYLAS